jgi:hypothetical protein
MLAFARPLAARVRSVRRPFKPSAGEGAYRLPREILDLLGRDLAPFRNRDAALSLATFLARYHSNPTRLLVSFVIDRRVLSAHEDLDLTEARVRGAIQTLEAVGYLERAIPPSGSRYKATADGLHRKPIAFVFGAEFAPLFAAANKRARRAKGAVPHARRPLVPMRSSRPSAAPLEARPLNSPKDTSEAKPQVNLGEITKGIDLSAEPSAPTALELALQRLSEGVFGKPRVSYGGA